MEVPRIKGRSAVHLAWPCALSFTTETLADKDIPVLLLTSAIFCFLLLPSKRATYSIDQVKNNHPFEVALADQA
jgi:hypothetical protein